MVHVFEGLLLVYAKPATAGAGICCPTASSLPSYYRISTLPRCLGKGSPVSAYLVHEVDLGRMPIVPSTPQLGPPLLQISPIKVIPKKNRPDKWRLIVDLSSPEGHSVNDAIRQNLCSVSYASLDHAIELAKSLGAK